MTLNLAHQGASTIAPPNSLPAFEAAIDQGADGVELDVQLSADGRLFVFHDIYLDERTEGRGPASALPLAALKELDLAPYSETWRGTRIPTLDEVFDALPGDAYVNIELKRYTFPSDGLEAAIISFIQHRNLRARVIVSSFNPIILWRLRYERFPLGLLYAPDTPVWLRYGQARHFLRLDALHPHHSQVRLPLPRLPINAWTVDDPAEMHRLLALGVHAIITNRPDLLKEQIEATPDSEAPQISMIDDRRR
jgi:glycerophosphoryl diester phosphodiesterase